MRDRHLVVGLLLAIAPGCKRQAVTTTAVDAGLAPRPADAATVAADYDPTALVRKGAEPVEVFLREPRTQVWANTVESVVGGRMRQDLKLIVPEARGLAIACHTLSCLVMVDAPTEKMELAVAVVLLVTLGPITANLGPAPDGRQQVLFLTEPRFAQPAAFVTWYQRARKRTLDDMRSGRQRSPFPILPAD